MDDLEIKAIRNNLLGILQAKAKLKFDEPIELASGMKTQDFLDVKRGLAAGSDLLLACKLILALTDRDKLDFNKVGGPMTGANALASGLALISRTDWFFVRDKAKGRGSNRLIEGSPIEPGDKVLLVDDVATSGSSLVKAARVIQDRGSQVTAGLAVVDRATACRAKFQELGIPFLALFDFKDLQIEPVNIV